VETRKLAWNAQSKIGSLDNAGHQAGGGDKKIEEHKVEWKAESKIQSLENAKHQPGGDDKQVTAATS
jgi:microtubule-associated protein tau